MPFPLISEMYEKMSQKLIQMLKLGAEGVKVEAAKLLSTLVYLLPNQEKKIRIISQII